MKLLNSYKNIYTLFLIATLSIAFFLRLIDLHQSLWLDEGIEWWAVKTFSLRQLLFEYMTGDFNPPAHHLLLWFWVRIFGDSEKILRFPSVLFGVGIVWFTYKIAALLSSKAEEKLENWPFGVGGISAALAACSGLLVYYSQEARMYAMATFFVTSSMYYFLLSRKKQSRFLFFVFCFLFTLALYSHYLTWFLLPVLLLYGVRYIFPLVFTIPWWPMLLRQLQAGLSSAQNATWARLSAVSVKNIGLIVVKFVTGRISFPDTSFFILATIVTLVLFWWLVWIGSQHMWKKERIIVLWAFVPLLIGIVIGFVVPVFSYFRFLFILPPILVLVSFGISTKRGLLEPVVAALLLFSVLYISGSVNDREDWKSLVKELHQRDSSPTVLVYSAVRPPFDYYDRGTSVVMDVSGPYPLSLIPYPSIWYIPYAEEIFGTSGQIGLILRDNGYSRTFIRYYQGVGLEHWERDWKQETGVRPEDSAPRGSRKQ